MSGPAPVLLTLCQLRISCSNRYPSWSLALTTNSETRLVDVFCAIGLQCAMAHSEVTELICVSTTAIILAGFMGVLGSNAMKKS